MQVTTGLQSQNSQMAPQHRAKEIPAPEQSQESATMAHAHGLSTAGSPLSGSFPPTALWSRSGPIQPKLEIGAPDDAYEQEADAVADQVVQRMAMDGSDGIDVKANANPATIQRKCAACEEEEKPIQRKLSTAPTTAPAARNLASTQLSNQIQNTKGGGSSLDGETRRQMERTIGHDFSAVRIHTGDYATQMSREISAKAFTVGNDIYFNAGQYAPASQAGTRLLAHELVHTVQQGRGQSIRPKTTDNLRIQRTISERCYSPMAWIGPTGAPGLGILAEKLIEDDYKRIMHAVRGRNAYFDDSFAGPIDPRYVRFIIGKNPSMPTWAKVAVTTTSLPRPDMVIHTAALQEFDEIKPASRTGILAGVTKIGIIDWYMRRFSLPYLLGTTYVPTTIINIASTTIAGTPIRFYLKVRRHAPGLIVYELCVETDWAVVTNAAAILLLIAIIAAILAGLPIPAPGPVPVPAMAPGTSPAPAPGVFPPQTLPPPT